MRCRLIISVNRLKFQRLFGFPIVLCLLHGFQRLFGFPTVLCLLHGHLISQHALSDQWLLALLHGHLLSHHDLHEQWLLVLLHGQLLSHRRDHFCLDANSGIGVCNVWISQTMAKIGKDSRNPMFLWKTLEDICKSPVFLWKTLGIR